MKNFGLETRLVVGERESEVKTKSLVQNNTLVPLLQNVRSEDSRHQIAGVK